MSLASVVARILLLRLTSSHTPPVPQACCVPHFPLPLRVRTDVISRVSVRSMEFSATRQRADCQEIFFTARRPVRRLRGGDGVCRGIGSGKSVHCPASWPDPGFAASQFGHPQWAAVSTRSSHLAGLSPHGSRIQAEIMIPRAAGGSG